jgi:glycine/D-amino acid oxidase-like deaminating enzyme
MGANTFAVIGGGIIGCLVARHLADQWPEAQVSLVERDVVGSGASRRSAGLHFPRGATERVRDMSLYSEAYYQKLAASSGDASPIHPVGMSVLSAAPDEDIRRTYCDRVRRVAEPGQPVTACGVPLQGVPDASRWEVEGAQYADVGSLAAMLASESRRRVTVWEGTGVTALDPAADRVRVRLSTGSDLTVDRLVLAPGPWLAEPAWAGLLSPLGLRVKKIVALHIERPPRPGDQALVLHDEDAFLLPLAERGHWLFSYTCQDWDVGPGQLDTGLSARDLAGARECLARYAPGLVDDARSGRVFCDAYSADRTPVVRAVDAGRRLVFAGAANGSGYRLAPAIAAEALSAFGPVGKESPDED